MHILVRNRFLGFARLTIRQRSGCYADVCPGNIVLVYDTTGIRVVPIPAYIPCGVFQVRRARSNNTGAYVRYVCSVFWLILVTGLAVSLLFRFGFLPVYITSG